jgi:hypothetical protein
MLNNVKIGQIQRLVASSEGASAPDSSPKILAYTNLAKTNSNLILSDLISQMQLSSVLSLGLQIVT